VGEFLWQVVYWLIKVFAESDVSKVRWELREDRCEKEGMGGGGGDGGGGGG
jgi:hypothetical protein